MKRTVFRNASGLPDKRQKTTARDMALLGRALQDRFPAYYKYFGTRTFKYGKRRYRNTNRLLGNVSGVDGIKTGYTRASGFNLVTSVNYRGRHIVAVVMGGKTGKSRNAHMKNLIARHLKRARRGKRTAPLVVAKRLPPLPRSRPRGPEFDTSTSTNIVAATKMPTNRPIRQIDLIALQIEEATSSPGHTRFKPAAEPTAAINKDTDRAKTSKTSAHINPKNAGPLEQAALVQPVRGVALPGTKDESLKGWQVQIAAVPTEEGAARLLRQAQAKAGSVLKSAAPVTVPVKKSGGTIYRARFAGFAGKSEARAVCAKLKRKSVNCLAVPN